MAVRNIHRIKTAGILHSNIKSYSTRYMDARGCSAPHRPSNRHAPQSTPANLSIVRSPRGGCCTLNLPREFVDADISTS